MNVQLSRKTQKNKEEKKRRETVEEIFCYERKKEGRMKKRTEEKNE